MEFLQRALDDTQQKPVAFAQTVRGHVAFDLLISSLKLIREAPVLKRTES